MRSNRYECPCLYRLGHGKNVVLIAVYVDDILIASRNKKEIDRISYFLLQFTIKNLGEVNRCPGIEFNCEGEKITLTQKDYLRTAQVFRNE